MRIEALTCSVARLGPSSVDHMSSTAEYHGNGACWSIGSDHSYGCAGPMGVPDASSQRFDFGLDNLLDGLAARLDRRRD
jgi:hypothetical protein